MKKSDELSLPPMTTAMRDANFGVRPTTTLRRKLLTTLAAIWTAVVFLVVIGALWPRIPALGTIATLLESFFSLHIVIAALVGLALATMARRKNRSRMATFLVTFALLTVSLSTTPLASLVRAAHRYGATISWTDHLRITGRAASPSRHPNQTVGFGTVEGKTLYADIYLPTTPPNGRSAPVLMMHGGGYISGTRSMLTQWDRWFAERGYTVFDIDYRLAPPPTWNQAAQDAACAMSWIAANAATYDVDANRMLVAGQSAGAGLALQVAYGAGDGTVTSSCGGALPQAKAVFALYPPDDFALGWSMNTKLGPASAHKFLRAYLGGSPEQFPERYRAVSAIDHVRKGLPPTFIAAGYNDHLVPYQGHLELVANLNAAGVPNILVTVPYAEHAFDLAWGSLGAQITRHVLDDFLQRYLPATEAR